jgi:hypothetical protein
MSLLAEARHIVHAQGTDCQGKLEQASSDFCGTENTEKRKEIHTLMQNQLERFLLLQQFYQDDITIRPDEQLRKLCSLIGRQKPGKGNPEFLQALTSFFQLLDRIN